MTRNDNKESRPIAKNVLVLKVTPMNPTPRKQSRNSADQTGRVNIKNILHTEVKKVTEPLNQTLDPPHIIQKYSVAKLNVLQTTDKKRNIN